MKILENASLQRLNTFDLDVYAKYLAEADSVSAIQSLLDNKQFDSYKNNAGNLLILGGGSNILFTKNFDGLIVKNNIKGIELLKQDSEYYYVKVGAGEVWHQFVLHCIQNGYAGVENLSLIPGSVGAAPIQNIGAYGVEQKDVFYELEVISIRNNKILVLNYSDCRFGYRDSVFKREAKGKFIIVSVTFRLLKKPVLNTAYGAINEELKKMGVTDVTIASISQAVCNIRRAKLPDPAKIGNAGSFFKNPVVSDSKFELLKKEFPSIAAYKDPFGMKLAAGWLIEQCGWKGKQDGHVGVHKDQALVLVNNGNANGTEIFELSEKIIQSVNNKFGIILEREVVVV